MELNALLLVASLACATGTSLVTLSHGGQLQGKTYTVYDTNQVTVFLGVRYAKPPTTNLRFEKPEAYESWTGIKTAQEKGSLCPQLDSNNPGILIGEEDCLFLDVIVPGEVNPSANKAVMVWIHGGSYVIGGGSSITTTGISVPGDVITVTVNYRLAALGFLSNGKGTGNYGLWDQRMALLWVHDNIAAFGGDPNKVTIFGESAGAGSVSSQTVSAKNNRTIFQRAIAQSGAVFDPWSWNYSPQERQMAVCKILSAARCSDYNSSDVYDCLRNNKTVREVFDIVIEAGVDYSYLSPHPDEDFFPDNISTRGFELANRFDNIVGHNSREGRMFAMFLSGAIFTGRLKGYYNGLTVAETRKMVDGLCEAMYSALDVEECISTLNDIYELFKRGQDVYSRSNHLIDAFGEIYFETENYRLLKTLYESSNNTAYSYRLDKGVENHFSVLEPEYVKFGADHMHDLPFVFNSAFLTTHKDTIVSEEYVGSVRPDERLGIDVIDLETQTLANIVITYWTNFAKTGNPNTPVTPDVFWPEYGAEANILRLSDEIKVVTLSEEKLTRYSKMEALNVKLNEVKLDQSALTVDGEPICMASSSMMTVNLSLFAVLVLSKFF